MIWINVVGLNRCPVKTLEEEPGCSMRRSDITFKTTSAVGQGIISDQKFVIDQFEHFIRG
jgi:hypothetical protein